MESSKSNAPAPIDLIGIWNRLKKSLKRLWLLILVLALLLAGLNYIREKRSYAPIYECKVLFSVGSGYSTGDVFTSSYFYDTAAAQTMADTFPYLLRTDFMRDLIIDRLDKGYINGSISTSALPSTNILELRVTSSDARDAYDILLAVVDSYPQAAVYMVDDPLISVREEPTVPTVPINRFDGMGALKKGALLGLLLGLAVAGLDAMLTRSVDRPQELKKLINLPIAATFPLVTMKKRRSSARTFVTGGDDPGMAEALRGLRIKVRRRLEEKEGKVVLLTSTIPGEGKTTLSANLALSLAQEGRRVVLVDADLRSQTVGRLFGSGQKNVGLMECLKDPDLPVTGCLKKAPGSELYYLSGASTKKRYYSLDSRNVRRVLEELSRSFDYVVVDTPPCGVVSDTLLFARYADCVLYVVKMDYANQAQILDGITSLHQRDVPLMGCVANGVSVSRRRYGYEYGYGYGYGYSRKKNRSSRS